MKTCPQCGQESTGAYCTNCGSSMVTDDVTRTSAPAAVHREGWQDDATSTGYVSHANPAASSGSPYRSAAPYGATPAPAPQPSGGRGNQLLAALVALVALAVVALGGYLFFKPRNSTNSSPAPSGGNSVATTPSTSSTSQPKQTTQTSQSTAAQAAPAPSTVTSTSTQAAPAPAVNSDTSSQLPSDVVSTVDHNGQTYGITRSGRNVTLYQAGSGAVTTFPVRGQGNDMKLVSISGCSKPVVAFNADSAGSAVYGWDGSGYQAYKASGNDLYPNDGAAASTNTYGVTAEVSEGAVVYRESSNVDVPHGNRFSSCMNEGGADVLRWDGH